MHNSNSLQSPFTSRRDFIRWSLAGAGLTACHIAGREVDGSELNSSADSAGDQSGSGSGVGVEVVGPRGRTPVSFIIDDSTCLVNMGHFCMPQFAEAWPDRKEYDKPWRTWPREIPDSFVREFGEWCGEHGVRGKYSIVPFPACVGRLDRELPGWSRSDLRASLKLVRELMCPNWDIHPEMITHTRVIDLATGHPQVEINDGTMENSYPRQKKSADELAAYLAYALCILKNCDLPCEGITTPGGFGNLVKPELGLAVFQAVRDVYSAELPHYFKYVEDKGLETWPKIEHASGLDTDQPRMVVNVPAGTGDWFGGWDGSRQSEGAKYATPDGAKGRMVELLENGRPAVMLCHWAGLFSNGSKEGFHDFQQVVQGLERRFRDTMVWMKVSTLARYGAARALTKIQRIAKPGGATAAATLKLTAPVACPEFTVRFESPTARSITLTAAGKSVPLNRAESARDLAAGGWRLQGKELTACFDLPRGESTLEIE